MKLKNRSKKYILKDAHVSVDNDYTSRCRVKNCWGNKPKKRLKSKWDYLKLASISGLLKYNT